MTVDELLSGHYAETAERCARYERVLVAQDTTELDYKGHEGSKRGLGPLAGPKSWGMLSHEGLALTEAGEPLGLLAVELWSRDPEAAGSRHQRHRRSATDKESAKWGRTLSAVMERLPETTAAVVASDRESDVFAYLAQPRRTGVDLVVRARHSRAVTLVETPGGTGKLFAELRQAPVIGYREFETCREGSTTPERVTLSMSVLEVDVLRPQSVSAREFADRVRCWAIRVWEEAPRVKSNRIEWYLLSTLPVHGPEDADRIAGYYGRRWRIETLHKTLKSGIQVEDLQIPDTHSLKNAVAAHYVVACRVLRLTFAARTTPDGPPDEHLTPDELTVLRAVSGKPIETVFEATVQVAKLAGYEPYRNAPPPGALRVWAGLQRLADMVIGFRAANYDTR